MTPSASLSLEFNNIGIYNAAAAEISSCLRIFTNELPSSVNGVVQFDLGFEVISLDEATIQASSSREFNAIRALSENGVTPDCSGKFETTTGIYTEVIETRLPTYFLATPVVVVITFNMSFKLTDPSNLILTLQSYASLAGN